MEDQARYAIVLTHGPEDGGAHATLAFALAVALQAMGCDVVLYLNGHAAHWARRHAAEQIRIRGFDSLQTYLQSFEEAGGRLYVCSSCFDTMDAPGCEPGFGGPLRPGVIPAGVTTLAAMLLERRSLSM